MNSFTDVQTGFGIEQARRYDRCFDEPGNDGYALRSRLADTIELLGAAGRSVLDAGMGAGRLCAALSSCGWTVSGLDASSEMVALARERLPDAAERLVQGPIEHLPYPDGAFDALVATGVLEYSFVERAVTEIARVVRHGGRVVVSYPNPDAFLRVWKSSLYYPLVRAAKRTLRRPAEGHPEGRPLLSIPAFRALLNETGLSVGEVRYTSHVVILPPLDAALPAASEHLAAIAARRTPALDRRLATQILFSCVRR